MRVVDTGEEGIVDVDVELRCAPFVLTPEGKLEGEVCLALGLDRKSVV